MKTLKEYDRCKLVRLPRDVGEHVSMFMEASEVAMLMSTSKHFTTEEAGYALYWWPIPHHFTGMGIAGAESSSADSTPDVSSWEIQLERVAEWADTTRNEVYWIYLGTRVPFFRLLHHTQNEGKQGFYRIVRLYTDGYAFAFESDAAIVLAEDRWEPRSNEHSTREFVAVACQLPPPCSP